MKKVATAAQLEVCNRFGAQIAVPSPGEKLGIALQSLDALPLNAVRHVVENGTCGWYIWGGEYSDDPDFYQPLCVEHLGKYCPQLLPYLALAPGWGVVLAPGHEDVWYEEWRAQPTLQADAAAPRGLIQALGRMETVVLVEHLRLDADGGENVKTIGVYRSLDAARAAVARLKAMPGFRDSPKIVNDSSESGFILSSYPLDKDHWAEGFGWSEDEN